MTVTADGCHDNSLALLMKKNTDMIKLATKTKKDSTTEMLIEAADCKSQWKLIFLLTQDLFVNNFETTYSSSQIRILYIYTYYIYIYIKQWSKWLGIMARNINLFLS